MIICDSKHCTGCAACVNTCGFGAVEMKRDKYGFPHPVINEGVCTGCGLCFRICPANHDIEIQGVCIQQEVYAAHAKDDDVRLKSSSGGLFSVFSRQILRWGGYIVACRFTPDYLEVVYDVCTSEDQLAPFRGSKYVQASVGKIYIAIKELLKENKLVLFVGTACQVAGLLSYLGNRKHDNLICIDLICHGVCSQGLYEKYIGYLRRRYGKAKVSSVSFREKIPSWMGYSFKVCFDNGQTYIKDKFKDPYLIAFNKDISVRESCHYCKYAMTERVSDITLADFWGYKSSHECAQGYKKGISCAILNTERGKELFEKVKDHLVFERRTMDEAKAVNKSLERPWPKNENSDEFWSKYTEGIPIEELLKEYCPPYPHTFTERLGWFVLGHYKYIAAIKRILWK